MKQKLKQIAQTLKAEFQVYRLVLRHPDTPRMAKWLLALAIGYVLMPFDLIPDFIPIIGQLDDLIIVPGLVYLALKLIPDEVIQQCREEMKRDSNV
ncbi:MAG: YkvA family protein [Candidatus Methylopumilus sp.]